MEIIAAMVLVVLFLVVLVIIGIGAPILTWIGDVLSHVQAALGWSIDHLPWIIIGLVVAAIAGLLIVGQIDHMQTTNRAGNQRPLRRQHKPRAVPGRTGSDNHGTRRR